MTTTIWWLRRDLRLRDNQALQFALARGERVVPLFIIDPYLWRERVAGEKRLNFLAASLHALAADMVAWGGRLVVRRGEPLAVLSAVMAESGATLIVAERDYTPYARRRDTAVEAALPLHWVSGLYGREPGDILKKDGTPYTVFTPFSRQWRAWGPIRVGEAGVRPWVTPDVVSEALPSRPPALIAAGEQVAQAQLARFTAEDGGVWQYGARRDKPAIAGTSQLSPYLRLGQVAVRRVLATVQALLAAGGPATSVAQTQASVWETELIWRDFYGHILYHFPYVSQRSFRAQYDRIGWRQEPAEFEAWCYGQTGYPLVDAGMRQLLATGWMHNRVRMVTASFLVKDLLIDWRWGERWFRQQLLDGDLASNNGGWQWSAGTGTDAAPYFRIFNPTTQAKKFDADGDYVRRWLPELTAVPTKYIHEPWRMGVAEQVAVGCVLGKQYPMRLVDHQQARLRTLAAYKAVRE